MFLMMVIVAARYRIRILEIFAISKSYHHGGHT